MTFISTPRHRLDEGEFGKPSTKKRHRLMIGTSSNGVYIDITSKGLHINGYYGGFQEDGPTYINLREAMFITWEDIEKERHKIDNPRKKQIEPDIEEEEVSETYLKTLPLVTINGTKYYIDARRRERRPQKNPKQIFKW